MTHSIQAPGVLNKYIYTGSGGVQQCSGKRHVYQRLGILTVSQVFSQLGIERYASTAILRVLTDLLFCRLEKYSRLLKQLSELSDANVGSVWTAVDLQEESLKSSTKELDDHPGESPGNDNVGTVLDEDDKRSLCQNVLVKYFLLWSVGKPAFPGFAELAYYLESQISWYRSLNSMLINQSLESSLVPEHAGTLAKHRAGKKQLPPQALISLIQTCPMSQREKKSDGDRISVYDPTASETLCEKAYVEFLERSSLQDLREMLPPIPAIQSPVWGIENNGDADKTVSRFQSLKKDLDGNRYDKLFQGTSKENIQNSESNPPVISNFLRDLECYRQFETPTQQSHQTSKEPSSETGTLLDHELGVSPKFPTTTLFGRLAEFEGNGRVILDYFMANCGDSRKDLVADCGDGWIMGNSCRFPLFLTCRNHFWATSLSPRIFSFFKAKESGIVGNVKLLSSTNASSISILVSLGDFLERRAIVQTLLERNTTPREQDASVPKIRLPIDGSVNPIKKIKLSIKPPESKIPKLRLFIRTSPK